MHVLSIGDIVAFEDSSLAIPTVRYSSMEGKGTIGVKCAPHTGELYILYSLTVVMGQERMKWKKVATSIFRYLSKVQKLAKMRQIKRKYTNTAKRLKYMKQKLQRVIDKQGISLDEETHNDVRSMMEDVKNAANTNTLFRKIF